MKRVRIGSQLRTQTGPHVSSDNVDNEEELVSMELVEVKSGRRGRRSSQLSSLAWVALF